MGVRVCGGRTLGAVGSVDAMDARAREREREMIARVVELGTRSVVKMHE